MTNQEGQEEQQYIQADEITDNNELQLAENIEIPDGEYDTNPSPSFEEKRELLKKTKILKQTWSILETFQKIKNKKLILSPVYQRNAIWSPDKQTSFIESIFMDILIPPIYVVEIPGDSMLEDNSYEVVDGKQRLTAIENFITNQLRLKKRALEYFTDLYGDKNYSDIETDFKTEVKSLLSSVLDIYVITANSPEFTKYDIFSRLNKGAEKLKVNEIRKAIYRSETLETIEDFVNNYISDEKSEQHNYYSKLFSRADIIRYEDFGRFYRSIAFYKQSKLDERSDKYIVDNYNSRPRDMINTVLNSIQKKEIILDEQILQKILKATLEVGIYLKDNNTAANQIEYVIDAVIPFMEKFEDCYEKLLPLLEDPEFKRTFEKSPSTTSNVNLRLEISNRILNT